MIEDCAFWTVAPNEEARKAAAEMVTSARKVALFKEFHVWTRSPVEDAHCHRLDDFDPRGGLYRIQLLPAVAAASKATHLVWLDPATRFEAHPGTILSAMRGSPIHVPLTFELTSEAQTGQEWHGCPHHVIVGLMRANGLDNRRVYAALASFFIVHRDATGAVNGLGKAFWQRCNAAGWQMPVEPVLAYVMQMLCADAWRHVATETETPENSNAAHRNAKDQE